MLETILNSPSLMALCVSAISSDALFLPATIIASRFSKPDRGALWSAHSEGAGDPVGTSLVMAGWRSSARPVMARPVR